MAIEWGITGFSSDMSCKVLDNTTLAPSNVLQAGAPFQIEIRWKVPPALASLISAGDSFRLRAYAESVGPGQEIQVGATEIEPGVFNKLDYVHTMTVSPNPLLGEGVAFSGTPVSGIYNIMCVLQHLNGGVPTGHSGLAEYANTVMLKAP
ncbi:MAG: hypothetical protein JNJ89_12810 [Rubrivivax sp.]|nr:hypothetical protein [Rubrivivax sp.]